MTTQTTRRLRVAALCLVTLVVVEGLALAQNEADRGGFTLLLNAGLGLQYDEAFEESAAGLAGLNLGVGGFLTRDLALMFRISGTNVSYDAGFFGDITQVSGVGGVTLQ